MRVFTIETNYHALVVSNALRKFDPINFDIAFNKYDLPISFTSIRPNLYGIVYHHLYEAQNKLTSITLTHNLLTATLNRYQINRFGIYTISWGLSDLLW